VNSYIAETGFAQKFDEKLISDLESKYAPKEVLLEGKDYKISKEEIQKRKDFRKMFTYTIDGEDAKDLDDAISIKKKEN
jgi:ribonuclease R